MPSKVERKTVRVVTVNKSDPILNIPLLKKSAAESKIDTLDEQLRQLQIQAGSAMKVQSIDELIMSAPGFDAQSATPAQMFAKSRRQQAIRPTQPSPLSAMLRDNNNSEDDWAQDSDDTNSSDSEASSDSEEDADDEDNAMDDDDADNNSDLEETSAQLQQESDGTTTLIVPKSRAKKAVPEKMDPVKQKALVNEIQQMQDVVSRLQKRLQETNLTEEE